LLVLSILLFSVIISKVFVVVSISSVVDIVSMLVITGMLIIIGFKLSESPDMFPVVAGCSHSCYVVGDGSCWLVSCWFEDLLSQ
jgi:hypothetical protein